MSTRVTSAIGSRRARENLVRLLGLSFPSPTDDVRVVGRGYSYAELRAAYIERVHEMHPDRTASRRRRLLRLHREDDDEDENENDGGEVVGEGGGGHSKFVELKDAWEAYRATVRAVRDLAGDDEYDNERRRRRLRRRRESWEEEDDDDDDDDGGGYSNFTLFGVGCSFADSPEESMRRAEIMDQACRGWFPDGIISPWRGGGAGVVANGGGGGIGGGGSGGGDDDGVHDNSSSRGVKLIDEGMFVSDDEQRRLTDDGGYYSSAPKRTSSLVQDADKFRFTRRK
ncbi:hypothetical protein ACHAXA_003998 [Cyclostephanos tholiformis]|uniref:J domain-containing protein n=1 Tax=Cyclostephanos tholiformis TaxID=382380 RepID=A0ABD3R9L6_9STRA